MLIVGLVFGAHSFDYEKAIVIIAYPIMPIQGSILGDDPSTGLVPVVARNRHQVVELQMPSVVIRYGANG